MRLKELKMLAVLKEISGYTFFLAVVFLVAYGNRPPAAFHLQDALKRQFVDTICAWVRWSEREREKENDVCCFN